MIKGAVQYGPTLALLAALTPADRKDMLLHGRPMPLHGTEAGVPGVRALLLAAPTPAAIGRRLSAAGITPPPAPGDGPLRAYTTGRDRQPTIIIGLTGTHLVQLADGHHLIITEAQLIITGLSTEDPDPAEVAAMLTAYPLASARRHQHRQPKLERKQLRLLDVLDNNGDVAAYAITGRDRIPRAVRAARAGSGCHACESGEPPPPSEKRLRAGVDGHAAAPVQQQH